MIGGNVIATVQVKTGTGKNAIGETVQNGKTLENCLDSWTIRQVI